MADSQPKTSTESNTEKDPEDWVTGDEPMTGAQASYLQTLAQEAGEEVPEGLSKAEASKRIEELQSLQDRAMELAAEQEMDASLRTALQLLAEAAGNVVPKLPTAPSPDA